MTSTPYTRGRSREYQVLRKLREEGWLCSRSAASHGPVDIFAGRAGRILMVQVKSGKGRATEAERRTLKLWRGIPGSGGDLEVSKRQTLGTRTDLRMTLRRAVR